MRSLIDAPLPSPGRPPADPTGPIEVPAVLLAAGRGTRLRPVTSALAKPLVPVLNVPLLFWLVRMLRDAGATDMVANTHHLHEQMSAAADRLRDRDGVRLTLVREDRLSGPAGGLAACRAVLPAADCYLVVSADAWADFDVAELVNRHRRSNADLTILATTVPDPRRFGVLDVADGSDVVGLRAASPDAPPDALVSCGIYVVGEKALRLLDPPAVGDYDYKDFVPQLLARRMSVQAHPLRGIWNDVGESQTYLDVNLGALSSGTVARVAEAAEVAGRHVWLQPGATLGADVTVTGPLLVGAGATVESGATLGHTVVGAGARVRAGATVTGSVIMPETVVYPGRDYTGQVAL